MEIYLPQVPAITILGIYAKDISQYHRDTCSTVLIAALLIIARNLEQPRCPLSDKWIKKMCYIIQWSIIYPLKIEIMKISGKWIELGKKYLPLLGNPERQIWYLVT